MIGRLLLIFLFLPFIEIILLIKVGNWIGFWPTMTLLIVMGLLGIAMVKSQGVSVVNKIKSDLSRGIPPGPGLIEGLLILIGGIFLIAPGLLTDLIGLFLVFSPTRKGLSKIIIPWLINKSLYNTRWYIRRQ